MSLLSIALIDLAYYESLSGESLSDENAITKVEAFINYTSSMFEKFCNRPLKARTFDFAPTITVNNVTSDNPDYSEKYAIFDGIDGLDFYFPTYPVNSITSFFINDVEIIQATGYDDYTGYHLYNSRGKLTYYGSFYPGYPKNIKAKWNGGYISTSAEMQELKFLCYDVVKTLSNAPVNPNLQSEKIGNYSYTNYGPAALKELQGLNSNAFSGLKRYRKEVL